MITTLTLLALATPCQETAETGLLPTMEHYARVEEELRAADISTLAPEARRKRADLLEEFRRYRLEADFTRWENDGARIPVFVDNDGRHCAVANLLRHTGDTGLVQSVVAKNNHAWVANLSGSSEFHTWLAGHGLTFEEAARIQGPSMAITPPEEYPGPGDAVPGRGAGATPSRPSGPNTGPGNPGPAAPGTPGPTPPTIGGSAPSPMTYAGEAFTDWGLWWEFNKLEWFHPRPLASVGPSTGDGQTEGEDALVINRRRARSVLAAEVQSEYAAVRAAAAIAYARAAGSVAVPILKDMLEDPVRTVRAAAVMGLAATESEEGVHALLEIVVADEEPGPGLRATAIVALGAARAEGVGTGVERMLPALLRERGDDEAYALLVYPSFDPSADVTAEAKRLSGLFDGRRGRSNAPADVASRATGALRYGEVDDVLPALLDAVGGRSSEGRRAAALALGDVKGGLEPLMTAFELEKEPLARGFALLSIGRHGGEAARDFLVRELKHGPGANRPWCALGLGLVAEKDADDEAREVLRAAYGKEANRSSRGAYLLAMGIARDPEAEDVLLEALVARDAPTRSYAAQGLGLGAGQKGRPALAQALIHETTPVVRTAIAQALALYGNDSDAETLLDELATSKSPMLRLQVAAALGFHGSQVAVDGLLEALENEELQGESRAAAIAGLAICLSGNDRMVLGAASARANYAIFPMWFMELLQQPM